MSSSFEDRIRLLSPDRRRLLEQLRTRRAESNAAQRDTGAVVLRPGVEPERLVLIHPSGGAVFCYVPLIRALRPGPAVVGFVSHTVDREAPVERRVLAVAGRILAALRSQTAPERCVLAGWSYGGSVAFEVARQLAEQGGGAPPVVLLDPPFVPDLEMPIPGDGEMRTQFVYDLARLHGVPAGRLAWLLEQAGDPGGPVALADLLAAAGVAPELTDAEVHDRYLTFAAASSALHRYQPPSPYPGPVHLLTAGREPEIVAGWRGSTTGSFRHVVLSGDHYTVLDADNLPTVVHTVEDALAVAH